MLLRTFTAALLFAGAAIQPASAATFLITYSGTVSSGFDVTGEFGTPAADLTGKSFSVVYTLTAPLAGAETYDSGRTGYIRGGSNYGTPSPLSARITINGITQAIGGGSFGQASQVNDDMGDSIDHEARDQTDYVNSYVYNSVASSLYNIVNSTDYTQPLTYSVHDGDYRDGGFALRVFGFDNEGNFGFVRNASATLTNDLVTIVATSAVPEPAAWAMMIAGFGLIGGSLRYRRRSMAIQFG